MSPPEYSEDFFKGPALALVIGINKYKYCAPSGQPPDSKQFTELKCAAQDADGFAEFLKRYIVQPGCVNSLINEQATFRNMRTEFGKLRDVCASTPGKKPLVFIFFSGHGMTGARGDSHLIPWDGERDDLNGTTVSNDEFNLYLKNVDTNRLVVFLDACHSGAMGVTGMKGASTGYNSNGLGVGEGRYVIASCKPDQVSWEGKKNNGIFTEQLLDILQNGLEDLEDEYINVFNLFTALEKRVPKAAQALEKPEQLPYANFTNAAGLVLAVNTWRKNQITKDNKNKQEFTEKIVKQLEVAKGDESLRQLLLNYQKGKRNVVYDRVFKILEEQFKKTKGNVTDRRVVIIYDWLESAYQEAESEGDSLPPKAAESQSVDQYASDKPVPYSQAPEPMRQLSAGDQKYVLEVIEDKPDFSEYMRGLKEILSVPISESGLNTVTQFIARTVRGNQPQLPVEIGRLLIEVGKRFREKWANAPPVPHTPSTGPIDK